MELKHAYQGGLFFCIAVVLLLLRSGNDFLPEHKMSDVVKNPRALSLELWKGIAPFQRKPCSWWTHTPRPRLESHETNGYIIVECSGGLNQMRRDLCKGVGIARLLNATLLLPKFKAAQYWNDTSNFADIFDMDYFVESLHDWVNLLFYTRPRLELAYHRVLNILGEVGLSEKCNLLRPYTAQDIPAAVSSQPPYPITCHKQKAPFDYVESLLPKLLHHKVILLRPSASQREDRFPVLAKSTQCQACFHALRLVKALQNEAESLLQQIPRPFVALHLRFEPDMIAYSRCLYNNLSTASVVAIDQAQGTRQVLGKKLQKSWRTRGKCPLTPKETASLLLALKVPSSTTIYIAAGTGLLEFHELASAFPRAVQKSNFLTKRSLKALGGSRAAAIDWYVCLHSDAYIATFTGNMDKMVISDRILASKQQNMILNRRYFAELKSEGKSTFEISGLIWQAHKQDVISGHNLPVTDCFCGEGRAPKP